MRRVPQDVAHLDERVIVQRSTKKACQKAAMVIGDRINRETEAFWEELASGGQKNSLKSYARAVNRARALGVNYKTSSEIAVGHIDDILGRLEAFESSKQSAPGSNFIVASLLYRRIYG